MTTTEVEAPGGVSVAQRWLARLSLVAAPAAVLAHPWWPACARAWP